MTLYLSLNFQSFHISTSSDLNLNWTRFIFIKTLLLTVSSIRFQLFGNCWCKIWYEMKLWCNKKLSFQLWGLHYLWLSDYLSTLDINLRSSDLTALPLTVRFRLAGRRAASNQVCSTPPHLLSLIFSSFSSYIFFSCFLHSKTGALIVITVSSVSRAEWKRSKL